MVPSLVLRPFTIITLGVVGARGLIPSTQSLTIITLGVVGARGLIPSTQSPIIRLGVVGARGPIPSTQSLYYYNTRCGRSMRSYP